MIGVLGTFHELVVDIYFHGVPNKIFKYSVDHSLEGGSDILQPKMHDFVIEDPSASGEGCFLLIWRAHLDLIVAPVGIHEAE